MNSTRPGTRRLSASSFPGFSRLLAMKMNGPAITLCSLFSDVGQERLGDRHEPLPAPVVLDRTCVRGETAAWEPPRQRGDRVARAFDVDESGRARGPQFELAKIDPHQRLDISPHHDVCTKPRVVVAKIGAVPAQNPPV